MACRWQVEMTSQRLEPRSDGGHRWRPKALTEARCARDTRDLGEDLDFCQASAPAWHLAPDLRHLPPLSSFNSDPLIPSLSLSPPASCPHPLPNRLLRPSVPGTSRAHCVQGGENKQVDTSRRPFPPSAAPPPSRPAKCLVDQHGWRIKSVHTPFSLFAI